MCLILAVHADRQYQASTFQDALHVELENDDQPDPLFLTRCDVSHWLDLVMANYEKRMHHQSFSDTSLKDLTGFTRCLEVAI